MDDKILFIDEDNSPDNLEENIGWNILIVDDEDEIHRITTHVLKGFKFEDRGINFLHAYSAAEAKKVIKENSDIALIFLDVVMESDDAGLKFIEWLRDVQGNRLSRVVLRTGQPGLAPEREIIVNYDINDYRAKTELTAVRLFTTTISSLRTYGIMKEQEENRQSLEAIIKTSWSLNSHYNDNQFLELIEPQLATFINYGDNSFLTDICMRENEWKFHMKFGRGRFQDMDGDVKSQLSKYEIDIITRAVESGHHIFEDQIIVGLISHTEDTCCRLLYIESHDHIKTLDMSVLKIFLSSIDSAYDNMLLSRKVENNHLQKIRRQKAILERLNYAISIRSRETSGHVRRVAECSELLARLKGCDEDYIDLIKTASPMHDIGKIGIPDSILLKPGKLNEEERAIINTHTTIGKEMFDGDEAPLIKMARDVAAYHHEHWDGNGYPDKLKGEEIPLSGRITAICDVFDALLSVRPYKQALELDNVLEIMEKERGAHFDPELLDLFMNNKDSMVSIYKKHKE